MNVTEYGNMAVGAPGSEARLKSDVAFLAEKLRRMEIAADALRAHLPMNPVASLSAIEKYRSAKAYFG